MGRNTIVTGTGFEGRGDLIRKYARDGMEIKLVREHYNPHDPNAVAVYMVKPRLGGLFKDKLIKIGYIQAKIAESIAKRIDAREPLPTHIVSFDSYPGTYHPRVSIRIEYKSR